MPFLDASRFLARAALVLSAAGICAAGSALAASASPQAVTAQLAPVAPATSGKGTFTASGASGSTVVVRWQLSVSGLSGQARRAILQTGGSRKIVFALCQPCTPKSHGKLILLGSTWNQIRAGGSKVVVTTQAHPGGELRGTVKRS